MACQKAGKKVLISLRGATGDNKLNNEQAEVLAKNLRDLFLEGKERPDIRPFGRLGEKFSPKITLFLTEQGMDIKIITEQEATNLKEMCLSSIRWSVNFEMNSNKKKKLG